MKKIIAVIIISLVLFGAGILLGMNIENKRNLAGVECAVVTGDLTDSDSLRRAVAGCDTVFNTDPEMNTQGKTVIEHSERWQP